MAEYIPKSALVAEIEKLRDELQEKVETSDFIAGEVFIMNYFISLLDTLEVKEVDLDKEIKKYSMELAMKENNGDWLRDIITTAKHFFELGFKVAQKGEKV